MTCPVASARLRTYLVWHVHTCRSTAAAALSWVVCQSPVISWLEFRLEQPCFRPAVASDLRTQARPGHLDARRLVVRSRLIQLSDADSRRRF
jgi:hypothetical protein